MKKTDCSLQSVFFVVVFICQCSGSVVDDPDLAGAHGLQGSFVLGGRHAGAAGCVAGDRRLRH